MGAQTIDKTFKTKDRETFKKKFWALVAKENKRNKDDYYAGNWGCVDELKIRQFVLKTSYTQKAKSEVYKFIDNFDLDKRQCLAVEIIDKNGNVKEYMCNACVPC